MACIETGHTPSSHPLDRIDLKMLEILQTDGRTTNVALAERVGITAPPCLRRLRTLEEEGYIRGYHADLDAQRLGFSVIAMVFIGLETQVHSEVRAFEELIRGWPMVREAYVLQGEADFLLKCVARTASEFHDFITTQLMRAGNVKTVRSAIVIARPIARLGIPLQP